MGQVAINSGQRGLGAKPPQVLNRDGGSRVLLVCEHASRNIPSSLGNLGLDAAALNSHIAWDPGAFEVAVKMSELLDAPLVASQTSRLVIDCNRPPDAADSIPAKSEVHLISANGELSADDREQRVREVYDVFHKAVGDLLNDKSDNSVLVTVHSFTPVYFGEPRSVELGILHDDDSRLADVMLGRAGKHTRFDVRRNEPYSAKDGVTHTLKVHGIQNGLLNVMIEIRNDLIKTALGQQTMGSLLAGLVSSALDDVERSGNSIGAA